MESSVVIRRANPAEHELLTIISFRSKSYWSYPDNYFQVWQKELTITADYIEQNEVFVCEMKQTAIAYYSLVQLAQDLLYSGARLEAGLWLDHMFVLPEFIGQGVGRLLFRHCKNRLSERGVISLNILADPNALGFYQKMGCEKHGLFPSSIPGRTTPRLTYRPSCDSHY
ncbi:GNAT family N-acetyltransferase [Desulfopila aestuarii]|uniref:Acetyltransferase (GNAT) domain-containing protein n=1 Tax=Desulfopila aestuarii DSM 18488 TaxID=1121416 RepID=A0A1M7YAZ1_9BACT|nr:GNAT family N-acetyltransferase [Desulfopila aestuarii]SHO49783.1 Acetyltransferase (GNAT) domain-containing protein [Desulfopila aestuarii DSM 18488]